MENTNLEDAAQFLAKAREAGLPGDRLPEGLRPTDLEAALWIQQRVLKLLGQDIGGWKCSVPSAERPILAAPIFASTIYATSPYPVASTVDIARIEPEVAFLMGHDLPKRATPYSEAEIRAAIDEPRLVLEILGTRYAQPGSVTWPEMMADNVQNQGLFIGPTFARGLDAQLNGFAVTIRTPDGVLSSHEGTHGDRHPLNPLYWLANFLAERGEGLRAGQVVTTGSYAGAIEVPIGPPLTVTYGDLGEVNIELTRAT
ncbi:MAG: 2-keto-4-pentenoate hydratase [Betaproteobacteria bacterium]